MSSYVSEPTVSVFLPIFDNQLPYAPDALNAEIIAKRLTERAELFILDGKGYRPTKHDS
jgi:hypothetical protein